MSKHPRSSPGRRARPGLSLEQVARATLAIIDEDGIGAASMRTVARKLGVEAQSLYTYVDSRDALFDAVVELVVDELDADPEVKWAPGDPWRPYLAGMARAVRRYARRHPHAFPLVATRPSEAPWVNPPLRSLRWIEAFLANLRASHFTDEQILFAYRSFNSFLLGFLLLETGAMVMADPADGDGSFAASTSGGNGANSADPVPGHPRANTTADAPSNPSEGIDPERFPTVVGLADGLAEDTYEREFGWNLDEMLDRVERHLSET